MGADQGAGGPDLPEDPEAIEKIIDDRRRRLAQTVDELVVRAHPKEIARRTTSDAKQRARGLVSDDAGDPSTRPCREIAHPSFVPYGCAHGCRAAG